MIVKCRQSAIKSVYRPGVNLYDCNFTRRYNHGTVTVPGDMFPQCIQQTWPWRPLVINPHSYTSATKHLSYDVSQLFYPRSIHELQFIIHCTPVTYHQWNSNILHYLSTIATDFYNIAVAIFWNIFPGLNAPLNACSKNSQDPLVSINLL